MTDKIYKVQTHMTDSWQVSAQIGKHTLIVDQASAGDSGPNPLDTFLFSLGACVSTIAKMVAREQQLVLNSIAVTVEGTLNPSGLAGKATTEPVGFKQLHISAHIDADLSESEKQQFLALVCARCPVHDNILRTSAITHSLS